MSNVNCYVIRGVKYSKVMFCRVCGLPVRVWEAYRTSKSFGYGYGSVTEVTEVPGIVERAYRTHRSFGRVQNMLYPCSGYCGMGRTELTEISGTGIKVLLNFQKFRLLVSKSHRTSRSSDYGYASLTKLPEVPGIVARSYKIYRSSGQVLKCCTRTRTRTPGICGTGVQNLQKFRARVIPR